MNRKWLAAPYLVWMVIFIVVPLVMIFYYAFTAKDAGGLRFTFEHLIKAFDSKYLIALWKSFYMRL